jgi:uncharacterized protein YndB with AHSA1/START domain
VIRRTYPQAVERVYAALADPKKKRRWYAEDRSHDLDIFECDFRVGGEERLSYRLGAETPFPGAVLENVGHFEDIVANRRVVNSSSMSLAGKRISTSLVTMELLEASAGTELVMTHQGAFFEGSGGPEMREMGWQKLLDRMQAELASR